MNRRRLVPVALLLIAAGAAFFWLRRDGGGRFARDVAGLREQPCGGFQVASAEPGSRGPSHHAAVRRVFA